MSRNSLTRKSGSTPAGIFGINFVAFSTSCEIRLLAPNPRMAARVAEVAVDVIRRIELKYSIERHDGVLAQINAAAGQYPIACDAETAQLLDYADTLHKASNGLFDITTAALRRAWNFRAARLPDGSELKRCLELVGWEYVHREPSNAIEPGGQLVLLAQSGMAIDFGGFCAEYAADRAAAMLIEAGVSSGYVRLDRVYRVIGPRPDGAPWNLPVHDPRDPGRVIETLPIAGGALTTASDATPGFDLNARRYTDILNPRTGQPALGWRAISVLAPLACAAGSSALIAMLKERRAMEFLKASGFEFLAVDGEGNQIRNCLRKTAAPAKDLTAQVQDPQAKSAMPSAAASHNGATQRALDWSSVNIAVV